MWADVLILSGILALGLLIALAVLKALEYAIRNYWR